MKVKILCCCIFSSLAILLSGCSSCFEHISYPFHYDESEINNISIIYTLEGYSAYHGLYEYETLLQIDEIDDFLTKFKEIKFSKYQFGDPVEIGANRYAVLIEYYNGDFEIITYVANNVVINGELLNVGRPNCDKEEFVTFINDYLTNNTKI